MMQKAFLRTYIGNIYALPEQVAGLIVFTGGMAGLGLIFGGMAGLGTPLGAPSIESSHRGDSYSDGDS